ncbi:hypothetical protein MG290_08745 [Flavobacterium sp. CBA20B-1]|uniref:hypothetical protein n=1 Tax=unclassified Flavobacterium TaxID=196869 RepID=UPI0022252D31|nr:MULTISPECIES: hypothetical protein [unclassified Flavobacterium]WCM41047.1 hypothetical protein MG290_08745 [Flavobacterium sp. CBA20B-1]
MNWIQIFNRLFELINTQGETYFGGTRFLNTIREVNYNVPSYTNYIEQRRADNKSTSRRDYYFDLLMEQPENDRVQIVNSILGVIGHLEPERTATIRDFIEPDNQIEVSQAVIPANLWNAERLIEYLERIDNAINSRNYELALTLSYTCLEGFYKSFIREKIPTQIHLNELTPMAVQVRNYIKTELDANSIEYPEQVIVLISTITNAVANARNNFSDSHSGNRAEKWTAIYIRDNVNSIVRLILNFI